MKLTLKGYEMMLDFSNNSLKFTLDENLKTQLLRQLGYNAWEKSASVGVANEGFKWKVFEAKIRKNVEEGKL